ncbi:MAG: type I 3-dehydroquinate dehydratase [Asgard group archaeon]|nr:type I 3-dehydroquinate dehydratase [Asgard group archaeon]
MLLADIAYEEEARYSAIRVPLPTQSLHPTYLSKLRGDVFLEPDPHFLPVNQNSTESQLNDNLQTYLSTCEELVLLQPFALDLNFTYKEEAFQELLKKLKEQQIKIILSKYYHKNPGIEQLKEDFQHLKQQKPFLVKLVVPISSTPEALSLLSLYDHVTSADDLILLPAGEEAKLAQILLPFVGAPFTYGYLSRPSASAQISLTYLRKTLKILSDIII